ncbi:hypothetical protein GCM10027290_02090 [Micromonospora sonneratiae]|uniref:Ig-like domain-containing protein n=1 Tax=Micromonospora sonneratiae TaxID=1184706 RepID=A0ABW3Y8D6_9ACTN
MPVPQSIRTAALVSVLLLLAGCGGGDNGTRSAEEGLGPGNPVASSASPVAPSTGVDGHAPATAAPSGGTVPGGSGNGRPGGTDRSAGSAAIRPTIVSFRIEQKPTCPAGTTANPIPGTPVVLAWKVTNVDKVALSVDGPGIYADNYPPTGTETLNFPCSGKGGDVQRHTYSLTVTNAAGKTAKSLVVTAVVHEIAPV